MATEHTVYMVRYEGTHLAADGETCKVDSHMEPRPEDGPPPTSKQVWCTLCKDHEPMTLVPWPI
jgi:hypothetical protein